MTEFDKSEVDALVIGAGPVGLTMACELLRHGVTCRIIDQNDGPTPLNESRALGIQARTTEVFRNIGVADRVLAEGRKVHGLSAYSEGRRIFQLSLDLEEAETAYPFILLLPQSRTERVLIERLSELGGSVERRRRLAGFVQDGTGVTATVADPLGAERSLRSRWLVGSDGPRSTVRHALNLAFEGGEYEERFLLADLRVGWNMPDDEGVFVLTPEGPVLAFPFLEPGRWRLVDTTGIVDTQDPERIVERFREVVTKYVAPGAIVNQPTWTSAFKIHRRVVDRFRTGRVFVAGDAAHLHSPAGGQGMNTGIQDAYNLAWKLALVIRGRAPESLLDSYGAERRPVAQEVLKGTDRATRVVTLRSEIAQHLRNRLVSTLMEFDVVRRRLSLGVSELGVGYRHSPIVAEDRAGLLDALHPREGEPGLRGAREFAAAPHPGDRAPDVPLAATEVKGPSRLSDVLLGTKHNLLLFSATPVVNDRLAAVGDLALDRYADLIRPWVVVPTGSAPAGRAWRGNVLHDCDASLHHRFGAASDCVYLIRPDGYVGYRSQPPDVEKLQAYLGRLFTTGS